MTSPDPLQAMSPAAALTIAIVFGVLYLFIGVMAYSHRINEPDASGAARLFRRDMWWAFHGEQFNVAGKRLCSLGRVLFVAVIVFLVIWALGAIRIAVAPH